MTQTIPIIAVIGNGELLDIYTPDESYRLTVVTNDYDLAYAAEIGALATLVGRLHDAIAIDRSFGRESRLLRQFQRYFTTLSHLRKENHL